MSRIWRMRVASLLALLAGVGLILLLHEPGNKVVLTRYLMVLLPWAPLAAMVEWLRRRGVEEPRGAGAARRLPLLWLCAAMVLFLFSSPIRHRWFYFLRWVTDPPGVNALSWRFATYTALLLPFVLWQPRRSALLLGVVAIAGMAVSADVFWRHTQGVFIGKDDHPSFVFRLWQLRETLPALMSYNPWWNAGKPDSHPLFSGTLAPGVLLWPFLRLFPVERVYTPGLIFLFFVFVPLMAALSVRALRGGLPAQAAAAVLSLGVSQHHYLWLLHFGTIGANLAAAMIMPVAALLYRLTVLRRTDRWTVAGTAASLALLLCYPVSFLTVLPLGVSFLLQWRRWNRRVWRALLVVAIAVLLLHANTLRVLLVKVDFGNVVDRSRPAFIPTAGLSPWTFAAVQDAWGHLIAHLRQGHPMLLFLGVLGIFFTPHRRLRSWYVPLLLGLAWLCGHGRFLAPHLQLTRIAIPMMFAVVTPAALHVGDLLRTGRLRWGLWRAAAIVLLALTAQNHARLLQNQGNVRYFPQMEGHRAMTEWIMAETPPDTRVLFVGQTVHAYGGGHVSVLPVLTGIEMMASDYYHFDPREVEYEFPPRPFRASIEGLRSYMDLYNVGIVLTYHRNWKEFLDGHPEDFEPAGSWGDDDYIRGYRVRRASNGKLWRGAGRASAHFNRITVTTEAGPEEIVLGYHWAPRLVADPPVELFPFDAGEGIVLIGVRPGGSTEFVIRYRSR
jgi:hypothetical protein